MFDIAFSELLLILLVAMIVIGPERLPKVARTLGLLWGRLQRFAHNVKNDIAHDMALEDARKLHDKIIQETDSVARELQEDGRTLQQQILQAQYQKPAEAAPAVAQPAVAATQTAAAPVQVQPAAEAAVAQSAAGATAAKPDQPAEVPGQNVQPKQP